MTTLVVNVRYDNYDIYIGRKIRDWPASDWGNPFRIGRDGDRDEVLAKYQDWINAPEQMVLPKRLPGLRGKVLGCWCAGPGGVTADYPFLLCHGQILAAMADALTETDVEREARRRALGLA